MSYPYQTPSKFIVCSIGKFYDDRTRYGFDYIKEILGIFDICEEAYYYGIGCGVEDFEIQEIINQNQIINKIKDYQYQREVRA